MNKFQRVSDVGAPQPASGSARPQRRRRRRSLHSPSPRHRGSRSAGFSSTGNRCAAGCLVSSVSHVRHTLRVHHSATAFLHFSCVHCTARNTPPPATTSNHRYALLSHVPRPRIELVGNFSLQARNSLYSIHFYFIYLHLNKTNKLSNIYNLCNNKQHPKI